MEIDEDYAMEGFVMVEQGKLVNVVDTVEHVADMLREEPGDGVYGRMRVCEAALRHVVDLLSAEVDEL